MTLLSMRPLALPPLKPVRFLGISHSLIKSFPREARNEVGNQLLLVQAGRMPGDWKAMPSIGKGAVEIRIHKPHEHRVCDVKGARMNGRRLPRDAPRPVLA